MWTCFLVLVGVVVLGLLGWRAWSAIQAQRLISETYRRAEQMISLLRPGRPLSESELAQHVPAHLRRPGELVTHFSEQFRRPSLVRAAVLSQLVQRFAAAAEDIGGFESQERFESAVTLRLMGWFEGSRLRLIKSPVEWRVGTEFVLLKEAGADRFAILRDAGAMTEAHTTAPTRTALRTP